MKNTNPRDSAPHSNRMALWTILASLVAGAVIYSVYTQANPALVSTPLSAVQPVPAPEPTSAETTAPAAMPADSIPADGDLTDNASAGDAPAGDAPAGDAPAEVEAPAVLAPNP